jgi:hypothetical protein
MENVRPVGRAFFPLDEELGLLSGSLTPSLQEDVVRLGAWMPFAKAGQELEHFRRTKISRSTVARITENAGAAYVEWQQGAVAHLERKLPQAPEGPEKQFLSVDGAMVPLVKGEWAEVKTLVLGEVEAPVQKGGGQVVHTSHHSYFSRLTDAKTFQRQALIETHMRGVERADRVVAVTDGAEWIQKFIDHHRHDAVRILDFPHAAERLNAIAQTVWGEGSEPAKAWFEEQRHRLKHEGPEPVLDDIRKLISEQEPSSELVLHLSYLEKRVEHMRYPQFQAAGWPIGDGAVESANKLVVEARLKGSGMHWARSNVNAMLALRNIVCSDRWEQAWPQIARMQRHQARQHQRQRRRQRLADNAPPPVPVPPPQTASPKQKSSKNAPISKQPWKPPEDHPWRRMPVGRARFKRHHTPNRAKT